MFLVLIPILNYISNLCLHLYLVNCLKAKFQKNVIFLVHIYHFVLHYTFQSSVVQCDVLYCKVTESCSCLGGNH